MVIEIWTLRRKMQKFKIENRRYAFTIVNKESLSFFTDDLGLPKGYPTHVPPSLLNPQPKQLAALQRRLSKLGLSVDAVETKVLFSWLFTSFAAFEDFVVYGSGSKSWYELEPIVTALIQLQVMNALRVEMNRQESEEALRGKVDFSFLIRLSVTYPRSFVVSTIKDDKVWHTLVTTTLYGIHSWNISGKRVVSYFFPLANSRNQKNAATILIDVARFTAGGRKQETVWETRLISPITSEKIDSKIWAAGRVNIFDQSNRIEVLAPKNEPPEGEFLFFDSPYGRSPAAGKVVAVDKPDGRGFRNIIGTTTSVSNNMLIPTNKVKMKAGRRVRNVLNGKLGVINRQREGGFVIHFAIDYDDGSIRDYEDEDNVELVFEIFKN